MAGSDTKYEDPGRVASDGRVTGIRLLLQQFEVLLNKNAILAWRNKAAFVVQILATFIFILLIYGIDKALTQQASQQTGTQNIVSPARTAVTPIPDCSKQIYILPNCLTLTWAPNTDSVAAAIVANIKANNNPPIPASRVMGFPSTDAIDAYMAANRNTVSAGLELLVRNSSATTVAGIDFGIQVNGTVKELRGHYEDENFFIAMPLQAAVEREIARFLYVQAGGAPGDLSWDVTTSEFAHPAVTPFSFVGAISPTFLLAAAMFNFVVQVSNVILERELKLRESMRVMGLYDSMWWLSWLAWEAVVMNFISSIFIVCFGMAFQFDLFLHNSFGVLFFHFWLFELSMTALGFFLSTFLARASSGTNAGFIIFLFGFILMLVVSTGGLPFTTDYSGSDWRWLQYLFGLFPPTLLAKGLADLGAATATSQLGGITWAARDSYCYAQVYFPQQNCDWSLGFMYKWFVCDFFIYMLLTLYFDKVNANEYGVSRGYLFFLNPSYWLGRPLFGRASDESVDAVEAAGRAAGSELPGGLDDDVAAEEAAVKERLRQNAAVGDALEPGVAVEVRGLVKSFKNTNACGCSGGATYHAARRRLKWEAWLFIIVAIFLFWPAAFIPCCIDGCYEESEPEREIYVATPAVRGNWFRIETGKLFALLGPNGAGKTTTINCLTGVLPVSAGNAVVYGHKVVGGGMSAIRSTMGVCPQFDMLYNELTGREHLRLFAGIKGLPRTQWGPVADSLLEQTKLESAADRRSSGYSGGMKRRLSVAVALIGDPSVVYLDEPTTGMDPISRRYVWDIVLAAKPGRAIVLTTHSMEEADYLADMVAIIAKGRLRCFGSSLRLKSKFGAGYRIAASVVPTMSASQAELAGLTEFELQQRRAALKQFVQSRLGNLPYEDGRVYTSFTVPRSVQQHLGRFLSEMRDAREQLRITDVQMSLTTLEEVFLTIAKEAERTAALSEGKSLTLLINLDGRPTPLAVPWGCELVEVPGLGERVEIAWVQDDEGRLVYSHHVFRGERAHALAQGGGGCCGCC